MLGKIDVGEKLEPVSNLNVMVDEEFVASRSAHQQDRLSKAEFDAQDQSALEAANRFFARLKKYKTVHQIANRWSLANITDTEKAHLRADYTQFQTHFAALHPNIDKLICKALEKDSAKNSVARFFTSDFKQLWGRNHFTQVLECEGSVLVNIHQAKAQAQFKARLVKKTMSHAQATTYTDPSSLKEEVAAFKPHSFVAKATDFREQWNIVSKQLAQIKIAEDGVKTFFAIINQLFPQGAIAVSSLNEKEKSTLRQAYKKFQPHILAMGQKDLNKRLVQSLTSSEAIKPPLLISDLHPFRDQITRHFTSVKSRLEAHKKTYFSEEMAARVKRINSENLQPHEGKTLFATLNQLQLSAVFAGFNPKFQTFLKNNLSSAAWSQLAEGNEEIDESRIPFLVFHKDSPEIQMYKNLINSIHYMKQGMKKLEDLNDHTDWSVWGLRTKNRAEMAWSVIDAVCLNIIYAKYYFVQAAKNPGLKSIAQEGLKLLEPLQSIPIVSEYLTIEPLKTLPVIGSFFSTEYADAVNPDPNVGLDVVAAWKKQQLVVTAGLTPVKEKLKETGDPDAEPAKAVEGETVLEVESEEPDAAPAKVVKDARVDAAEPVLMDRLKQLSEWFIRLKADEAPEASPQNKLIFKDIESNFAEFTGYFKELEGWYDYHPGSFQKILKKISEIEVLFSSLGADSVALIMNHLMELRSEFGASLLMAADDAEFNLGLKPGAYSEMVREKFDNFYAALIDNVPLNSDQMGLELLIDTQGTQKRLTRATERLWAIKQDNKASDIQKAIFGDPDKSSSSDRNYTTLVDLYMKETDFSRPENRELFLTCYKTLQPYLLKIDYTYDLVYYLRELQTPEDFSRALNKIVQGGTKLLELIEGLRNANKAKEDYCVERINYLKAMLEEQENQIGPERIQAFKEKVFSNYINAQVLSVLEERLGSYAGRFLSHIMPQLLAEKARIFAKITIEDDIEEKMAEEIDAITKDIFKNNIESFKERVFDDYINMELKNSLVVELGIYAELFITSIMPDFTRRRAELLQGMNFDDIESQMPVKLEEITREVLEKNQPLRKKYSTLNGFLQQVEQILLEEYKAFKINPNPCRAQKIVFLEGLKKNLGSINAEQTSANLQMTIYKTRQAFGTIESYDALINLYRVLSSLQPKIQNNEEHNELIQDMLGLLADDTQAVSGRLNQVLQTIGAIEKGAVLVNESAYLIGAFKYQLFDSYINTQVRKQLIEELGIFADYFLHKISPDLRQERGLAEQLSVTSMQENADKLAACVATVIDNHKQLKHVCKELNNFLNTINRLIKIEEAKPAGNPCRAEKIEQLLSCRATLMNAGMPQAAGETALQDQYYKVKAVIKNVQLYDKLIAAYDNLKVMEAHVNDDIDTEWSIRKEKLEQINTMQGMLITKQDVPARLKAVKNHALSKKCEEVLLKSSDFILVKLFKDFVALFSDILKSASDKSFTLFKQDLTDTNKRTVPQVDSQSGITKDK